MREIYSNDLLNNFFNGTSGKKIFHIIPEPAIQCYLAYPVSKSSPFIHVFNSIINDIHEFGFKKKSQIDYQIDVYTKRVRNEQSRGAFSEKSIDIKITLTHLEHVFMFYFACSMICIAVFTFEYFSCKLTKN